MTIRLTKREGDYVNFYTRGLSTGKFWVVSLDNGMKVTMPRELSKEQIAEFIEQKGWTKLPNIDQCSQTKDNNKDRQMKLKTYNYTFNTPCGTLSGKGQMEALNASEVSRALLEKMEQHLTDNGRRDPMKLDFISMLDCIYTVKRA